jgi:hypothetical protein
MFDWIWSCFGYAASIIVSWSLFFTFFSLLKKNPQTPNFKKIKKNKNYSANACIIRNMYRPNMGGPMGGSDGRWLGIDLYFTLNGSV